MLTFNDRILHEFKKLVTERSEAMASDILSGALGDIADYKNRTGQLRGLQEGVGLLEDAISICEGKPNDY